VSTLPTVPAQWSYSYGGLHVLVRQLWGKASEHRCVNPSGSERCKGQASQWAYDHHDPTELKYVYRGRVMLFSVWPEFYMPLCRVCHKQMDLAKRGRPIHQPPRPAGQRRKYVPKTAAEWEQWQLARAAQWEAS
jgi:hypothetical protein